MTLASSRYLLILTLALFASLQSGTNFAGTTLQAQGRSRMVPPNAYFAGFGPLYEGNYGTAADVFGAGGKSAIRSTEGLWIDSICYSTMLGECYFQMGNNVMAMESYNKALRIFVTHSNWMLRITPESLGPVGASTNDRRSTVTWGKSTRNTAIGSYPESFPMLQGNTQAQNQSVARNGGVLSGQQIYPVRGGEIARCIALAIYRRQEILGPISTQDELSRTVAGILQRRPAPPNHWLGVLVDVQHGLALAAIGKTDEAVQTLQRSLAIAGQFDHPLTSLALLQLGRIALQQQNYDVAQTFFLEASYSAVAFQQYQQVEDALDGLSRVSMITKPGQMPQGLIAMSNWGELRGLDALRAKLSLALAEANVYMGNLPAASSSLENARRAMTRTSMAQGRVGIRYGYLSALIAFQSGNATSGTKSLGAAIAANRAVSTRLYQTELTNQLFLANSITERSAQLLFDELLREPTDADWITEPFETLTVLLSPNPVAMENWFNTTIIRKQPELSLELADRIRRMRFFATLPLGGRLLALRWVLEAPESALDTKAKLQRQDLESKFPEIKTLHAEAEAIEAELRKIDIQPADKEAYANQRTLLEKLAAVSDKYELLLSAISLRRTPSEFLFPPLRTTAKIREQLEDTQLVLSFFSTSRAVHAFLFTKKDYVTWRLDNPRETKGKVADLLQQMGLVKRDAPVSAKQLADPEWKKTSEDLLKMLIPSLKPGFWNQYDELVVVPDDVLWYVPFEALHTDDGLGAGHTVPLTEAIAIRYAPTAGLAVPEKGARPRPQNTAIVVGRLFNGEDAAVTEQHYERVRDVFISPGRIDRPTAGPSSLLAKVWDQMVVIDDSEDANRGEYWAWSPGQADRNKPGSDLASWLRSPLGGPEVIYLPGFHSAAEDSIKGTTPGTDLFITSLGLMATGSETVAISRWHSAGSASMAIVEGLGKRLDTETASKAWQQAIADVRKMSLDPDLEPRIKGADPSTVTTLDSPYFWADMMLIDTGIRPNTD